MFFSFSSDYIKYLNDPDCNGMNYDQWKEKQMRRELEKSKKDGKNHYRQKYNY